MRFGVLAGAILFLCACRQDERSTQQASSSYASPPSIRASEQEIPSFTNEIAQLDDSGLAEFLEENANELVYLEIGIPQKEFDGAQEGDIAFFTVYDACLEDLQQGEKPNRSKCEGTEYQVPQNTLAQTPDGYKLTGYFRPTEKAGPNQGLFSVQLAPQR